MLVWFLRAQSECCGVYNIQYGGLNVVAVAVVIDRRLCFIALHLPVRHMD
jgi:hypothetical protein